MAKSSGRKRKVQRHDSWLCLSRIGKCFEGKGDQPAPGGRVVPFEKKVEEEQHGAAKASA